MENHYNIFNVKFVGCKLLGITYSITSASCYILDNNNNQQQRPTTTTRTPIYTRAPATRRPPESVFRDPNRENFDTSFMSK